MRKTRLIFLAAATLAAAQIVHAQSNILGTNLIVNGNAESGSAGTGISNVVTIPGWTRTGNATVLPYNLTGYMQVTDPAPPDHGFQYFACQSGSTLTQTIDVSSGSSVISSGMVKFTASVYLGSGGNVSSAPQMGVAFQNGSGQTFSSITLGPTNYPGGNGMSLQQQMGLVPSGTTRITVTLTFGSTAAPSFADSASLMLTSIAGIPATTVLGPELIVNGRAETGPNAPPGKVTLYVPGWSTAGEVSVAPYGGTNWISSSAPGPTDRGVNLFCGSVYGGTMYQDIDVSPAAAPIDAGQVTYVVSAWLGAVNGGNSPTLTYEFFDWSGNQLATTAQLGPVVHAGLVPTSATNVLPARTRRVHIVVSFPNADRLADNISFSLTSVNVPNVVLPQLAFGGGWYTALYFTNLNGTGVSFPVTFTGDNSQPLTIPGQSSSSITVNLQGRGTALIEAPNSGSLITGYVTAALPAGVTGYGVFRQSVPGAPDQEAVVPLSPTNAATSTLVFDDTKYTTGVAVANLSSAAVTVAVTARDSQGNTIGTGTIPLAANAKTAAALRSLLPGVVGSIGSVDFTVPSGNAIAVLGLRFNGTAFTSIPATNQ